jgi:hypothetical protein
MPLSQIVSASIEDGAVAPVDLSSVAQYTGFKNKIINGAFNVWQRATTYALTGSFAYGSADRWAFAMGTTAAGIANQVTSDLTGFQYALKLGRNSGSTSTGFIYADQVVENANTYDLQGQTVTVSFYAKAGANYSAAGSVLGLTVNTGTGADATNLTSNFGGWTGNAQPYSGAITISTTWTRYSITCTVGSTITNIGILFSFLPSGTAGADDNVYITGVQLEKGSVATSFDVRPFGTELSLCQRYYEKSQGVQTCFSQSPTATNRGFVINFLVQKRATPTMTATFDQGGSGSATTTTYTGGSNVGLSGATNATVLTWSATSEL